MTPGTVVSHYRIISRLGEGGMGEVWLAEDLQLERHVALKILSGEGSGGQEALSRLLHEGRTAAALNHPNIAQIHEIGEFDGKGFLAMEYVEGSTLRQLMRGTPMAQEQVIDIALQIADALEEAHSKGIVHRDIKPGNVIVTPRGQAKVLDFGLAKMEKRRPEGAQSSAPTEPLTSPGQVMGTLEYMSPEQCLGEVVDARSDIFSLGSVLYEMLAGRRAFTGSSSAAIYDGILNRKPPSPTSMNPLVSPGMDQLVAKAMEKDRSMRYQSVADLRADFRRLKRDSSSNLHPPAAVPVSSRKRVPFWLLLTLPLAAALLGVVLTQWFRRPSPARVLQADPFTSTMGSETQPSFSPNGNQVAFAWNRETDSNWDIYVSVVDAGTPLRLTDNPATDHSPAWSPDGRYVAFLRQSDAMSTAFMMVPALGGAERKLVEASNERTGVDAPYTAWLPGGKELVISNKDKPGDPLSLRILNVETGRQRQLTTPAERIYGDGCIIVRPDGKVVYFVRTQSLAVQDLYEISVTGGEPKRLTFDNRRLYGAAWDPVDKVLLFSSARGGGSRIWRLDPASRKLQQVVGVGEQASFLAVSSDGTKLAYTRSVLDTNVWRYPLPGNRKKDARPAPILQSTRMEQGPQYSPDGTKIVFASNRGGASEIWMCGSEGENCIQLSAMNGSATGSPSWSPDGREIAFDSRPGGNPDIYVIPASGGTARRLTSDATEEVVPFWSRDGKSIYFGSNRSGTYQIYKMPAQGGKAEQVTRNGGFHGEESRDGKWLYYTRAALTSGIYRMLLGRGTEEVLVPKLPSGFWAYWTLAGGGIYYGFKEELEGKGVRYSLRFFEPAAGRDRELMEFPRRPFNAGLSVSPDLEWCLYTQVDRSDTDIMMARDYH